MPNCGDFTLAKKQLSRQFSNYTSFDLSFLEDVARYLSLLGGDDLLDEDAPDQACKPSTVKHDATTLGSRPQPR